MPAQSVQTACHSQASHDAWYFRAFEHESYLRIGRGLLTAFIVVTPLLLSGCLVQSKIQGRYIEDQGECRSEAEAQIGQYETPGMTPKQRNIKLVTLFSNCMGKRGWQVAKPKPQRVATTDGPHGPLDPYPSSAARVGTPPATAAQQPTQQGTPGMQQPNQSPYQQPYGAYYRQPATQGAIGQRPVQTQSTTLSPSGSMPALSSPVDNSYYRGGYYGRGAGRNF